MTLVRVLIIHALLAILASAQIVALHFPDEKAARKYKKYLQRVNGEYIIPGEVKSGIIINGNTLTTSKNIQLYVPNRKDPSKVPYKLKDGARVSAGRKGVLSISRDVLRKNRQVTFLMRDQTLVGLAMEYRIRLDQLTDLEKLRDARDKTTRPWFIAHRRVVSALERTQEWLANTCFPQCAKSLDRKIHSESKKIKDDAIKQRSDRAAASLKPVETPTELVEAAQGTAQKFGVQESQHIRIIFNDSVHPSKASQLLKLGESIIEGFRQEFVDPYLDDDFVADHIPEDIFFEIWFGPDNVKLYEKFWNEFYGRSFTGQWRAQRLASGGTRTRFVRGVSYVDYWKSTDQTDHEGCMAHGLGHALANINFNSDRTRGTPDWLEEGVGYYVSFEFLGRNAVTCKDFKKRDYSNEPGDEGKKTVQLGQRAIFNEMALKRGPALDTLVQTPLYNMQDPDLAKSWSFFDYVARKEGREGVLFLKDMCEYGRDKGSFIREWRESSRKIFSIEKGVDPLKEMDKRWKEFAEASQKKDSSLRKRRR